MSFIKKGLKKVWGFVKKHWVEIVLVAAVVFTAGIATVGVGAFSSAIATEGFFSAVGSTMWAGVTATGASLGIGTGASGTVAASAGVTGQGLGAALGWGSSGLGLGVSSAEYAANAAALGVGVGEGATTAATAAANSGATLAEAEAIGQATGEAMAVHGGVGGASEAVAAEIGTSAATEAAKIAATKGGMSTAEAMMWSTGVSTAGSMLSGYAQGKAMEKQLEASQPNSYWGVQTSKGGREGSVDDYLFEGAVMQPLAQGADDPTNSANSLMQAQLGGPTHQAMGGALMTQPGRPFEFQDPNQQPLMQGQTYG